jgi:hypothetical protein
MVGPPPDANQLGAFLLSTFQEQEVPNMWLEATRVALIGFSVVFITLWILALSVKLSTLFCRLIEKKGGKKS